MLNKELTALQEELNYHRNSIQELEERIAEVKVYDGYAAQATEAVEDAIEQIGMGKYLWLFKEHILSMFPEQPPAYLEEKINTVSPKVEEIKPEKSYYELTGKPDLRPTTYDDLAPNITYSSDGRAYIGFDDKQEAEAFRESIDIPSLLDDAQMMNNYKWEVKFYCDRQYLEELQQELEDDWTPEQKAELDFQERLVRIAPDIFYDGTESSCYLGFRSKGRADNYGSYLTRILNIAEKYVVTNNPCVTTNTKYELRLNAIAEEDARHLSNFNLKKDYDHPDHHEAREIWRITRQREVEPAFKSRPKAIAFDEIKLGDIVTSDPNKIKDKQYKVIAKKKLEGVPHLEAICIFNREMPALVNNSSWFKEVYPVDLMDVCIDPLFRQPEKIPSTIVEQEVKKSEELATDDFPNPPYKPIPLSEVELCDVVTTSPNSKSGYEVREHKGGYIVAVCLYNVSLPKRVGEEFTFSDNIYLVEKGDISLAA